MGQKKTGRLLAAFAVVLVVTLGLVVGTGVRAYADLGPVKYLDANGEEQTCTEYTTVTSTTTSYSGWCVVSGKVTFSSKVTFNGDAHLILCDGAELKVSTGAEEAIGVNGSLTIYAQSKGDSAGRLNATCSAGHGISVFGDPATITINGGNVVGEGVGRVNNGIIASNVIVNGGSVLATGAGHGIFAVDSASINGGTVTMAGHLCINSAVNPSIADGITVIEGDDEASAKPVEDPSTWVPSNSWARTTAPVPVPVTSVELDQATVTLEVDKTTTLTATVTPDDASDKKVKWTAGGTDSAAVTLYSDEACKTPVELDKVTETLTVYAKGVSAGKATVACTSHADKNKSASCDVTVTKAPDPVKYLDANGEEQTCTEYTTVTSTTRNFSGWCVASGKVSISEPSFSCSGDTHLILCDGAELNVTGDFDVASIVVNGSLTIYAQSTGDRMGILTSTCLHGDGFRAYGSNGDITINGGNVVATGSDDRSGMNTRNLTINGGSLTATGGLSGIYTKESLNINGGTVTMSGGVQCMLEHGDLSVAKGIAVIAGNDETSAQLVANPSTWARKEKWARAGVPVPVKSVELDQATATLEVGKTAALKATVKPDNATDKSVTWKSSNEKVATVKDGVVTAVAEGKATITATSVDNDKATATCVVTVKGKQMFRLYNPNSGEHFYTSNAGERDSVKNAGWTYEGVGWTAPESGSPVYRLYNEFGGEHHYTTSKGEHDSLVAVGWKDEGVGWYSGGSKPLYRQYNPNAFANNHNYTTSANERDTLLGLGWRDEGIAWYGI